MTVEPASEPNSSQPPSRAGYVLAVLMAWVARAVPLAAVGALAALVLPLPWWLGLAVGLIAAAIWIWMLWRSAATRLLRRLGAKPTSETEHPRLFNLVQGLSLGGGRGEPDVYVINSSARNAVAVAQGSTAAMVTTTGLLDSIDLVGLEAVVAEAVVRISSGDAEAATVGAALFGPMRAGPLGVLLSPIADSGLSRLLGPERDLLADRRAVALTRYPPGLLKALDTIRSGSAMVEEVSSSLDHVWFVPPRSVGIGGATGAGHTSLDLRIDVLGEL